jgi:hypothetical protein
MRPGGAFALGALVGVLVMLQLKRARDTSCCERLANAARDKIAVAAGPFAGVVGAVLDATGLTNQIPSLLDTFGVPR